MRYILYMLVIIFALSCTRMASISQTALDTIATVQHSGVTSNKPTIAVGDTVSIRICCELGELPLEVTVQTLRVNDSLDKFALEGQVCDRETGEFFRGIKAFIAETIAASRLERTVVVQTVEFVDGTTGEFKIGGDLAENQQLYFSTIAFQTTEINLYEFTRQRVK